MSYTELGRTYEQHDEKMAALLADVPDSIAQYISAESYERGHSGGYDEVYSIAVDMKFGLTAAIEKLRAFEAEERNRQQQA